MVLINENMLNIDSDILSEIDNIEYSNMPNVVGIAIEIKQNNIMYVAYMTDERGNIILSGKSNNFSVALSHAKGMYRGLRIEKENKIVISTNNKMKKISLKFKKGKK